MKNISFKLNYKHPENLLRLYPLYQPSPLLYKELPDHHFWLKDETQRMSLGSFKALGGMYAVARLIMGDDELDLSEITHEAICEKANQLTFVCASAGNHGMAVATGAALFGAKARVHLSDTVPESFTQQLEKKGAQVIRSGRNYEESIAIAIDDAAKNNYIHLADGSWPNYTEPPRLVMEGYTILAEEMRQTFEAQSNWPTHVFLQAGVGGLAAAMTYMIRQYWRVQPKIIIVEPDDAPCLKASIKAGKIVTVAGGDSNMGRLDCKTASMLAFEVLSTAADDFITLSDSLAQDGARVLESEGIPTTPSGAAAYAAMKEYGLSSVAKPLVIVTEGALV